MDVNSCCGFMRKVAHEAGLFAKLNRSKVVALAGKEVPGDMVGNAGMRAVKEALTEADIACQEIIMKGLVELYPDFGIMAEETSQEISDLSKRFAHVGELREGKYTFLIDPIDGTKNYMEMNAPTADMYGILISLARGHEIIAGVVYYPELGTTIHSIKGQGTFVNGERFRIKPKENFDFGDGVNVSGSVTASLSELSNQIGFRACCFNIYALFDGRIKAYLSRRIGLLDFSFMGLAVTEAGGFFGDLDSRPVVLKDLLNPGEKEVFLDGFILVVNSESYHRSMVKAMKESGIIEKLAL